MKGAGWYVGVLIWIGEGIGGKEGGRERTSLAERRRRKELERATPSAWPLHVECVVRLKRHHRPRPKLPILTKRSAIEVSVDLRGEEGGLRLNYGTNGLRGRRARPRRVASRTDFFPLIFKPTKSYLFATRVHQMDFGSFVVSPIDKGKK